MSTQSSRKCGQPLQFTPAIEKLFNRVLCRIYRGNTRKKSSREVLLSLQHTEVHRKYNNPLGITSSRLQRDTHMLTRKSDFIPKRSDYTTSSATGRPETKPWSTYLTERKLGDAGSVVRCKTQSVKSQKELMKKPSHQNEIMIKSDLFPNNKMENQVGKGRCTTLGVQYESISKVKQLEGKRRISSIIRTRNKLAADLAKNQREQPFFKPWDVEANDDLFF